MGAAPTILIVDDDPLMRRLYQRPLERSGYRLLEASNGREALEVTARELPQVVVMDVMLPEMDGLTAVLELKKSEVTRAIPVVVVSSNSQYYLNRRDIINMGAASFLSKPFGAGQLLEAIRQATARSPRG